MSWRRSSKTLVLLSAVSTTCLLLLLVQVNEIRPPYEVGPTGAVGANWRMLSAQEINNLSVLGRRLFLGEDTGSIQSDKNFTILVLKHGPSLEPRLIFHYTKIRHSPFEDCSASNCRLTYDQSHLSEADAVLVHLQRTAGFGSLPQKGRRPSQRWVFLTDESPHHTFSLPGNRLADYDGLFNWSMSYRMDADVPVPYGRAVPLSLLERLQAAGEEEEVDHHARNPKMAAIMISDCGGANGRMAYLKELGKHLPLDTYGACGTLKCEGHFRQDCAKLRGYKFYLAFENSNCREYSTEKVWWNAYHKGSVPVVMGASREDCRRLLPPGSYVHVDDFPSPRALALHLLQLSEDPARYNALFAWRRAFRVLNEHGYFQSPVHHYCRLCEALNYNDPRPKTYRRMEDFMSVRRDCRKGFSTQH
ncbi:4-galactosyl-N-acetylglucosaminide 3-alpha-L-fucosyltransferase FUT6-like isoform X2 [Bacillus rossius redtenbacheri]